MKTTLPQIPVEYDVLLAANSDYASPKDRVARMLRNGEILRVRHGLYYPAATAADVPLAARWVIANQLYGPSYVSAQSVLAQLGVTPEAVPGVTSCCLHRARRFDTALGEFSYLKVPHGYFAVGLQVGAANVVVASAAKALCDVLAGKRNARIQSRSAMRAYLLDDLRLDVDALDAAQPRLEALAVIREAAGCGFKEVELELLARVLEEL
jgi:hypothetical protein